MSCCECGKKLGLLDQKIRDAETKEYYCSDCWKKKNELIQKRTSLEEESYLFNQDFKIVTSPTIPGYRVTEVWGVVTGMSPRSRGMLGQLIGSLETTLGGEVTAFTSEIEKAKVEAISRAINKAKELGANAIISLDIETSSILPTVVLVSATGTAVKITTN